MNKFEFLFFIKKKNVNQNQYWDVIDHEISKSLLVSLIELSKRDEIQS